MRKLEIVFTKSKKKFPIGSWLIRLWTEKSYSHVARKLTLYGDIEMFYQSSDGKVNYEVKEIFNKKHKIIKSYILEIEDELYKNISKACVSEAGKPYGTLQNIGIVLVDICKFFGFNMKNPWKNGRNCSELLYLNVFKISCPELDYDPETIKPHNIEEILINNYL
jgi:gamma-glutamylcysteine synthetase